MKMHKSNGGLRKRLKGTAAVELALVSIPLILMVLALIDFARAMFVYDQLLKAVRDGARYMTFFDPTDNKDYPVELMKKRVLSGSVSGTTPIVPGLTLEMISLCDRVHADDCPGENFGSVATGSGNIDLVKVTISGYQFTPIFPGVSKLTTFTFEPISTTMRQLY